MTERVLGPTGSKRRRRFMIGPFLLIAACALMFTAGAQAVHGIGVFELEGNAVDDPVGGEDWESVYAAVQANPTADNPCLSLGALDCSFLHDPLGDTIFTTGGSKDDLDISSWRHTSGSVPDKDEIEDAMAALYDVDGDQILYFAADRFATNGSADFGFWFFKSDVSTNPDGTFSGVHTVGDLLLLGTFTNGGADTTIRAFVWDPANATINGVLRDPGVTLGDCTDAVEPDNGCGTVNDATTPGADSDGNIASPWPYQAKKQGLAANLLPPGAFFEGGINLSEFGLAGCFSSFMAETRSSPSIDATLKDFVVGEFQACGATMTTDASSNSIEIGGSVTDSATISVTGASPPAPTGNVLFYLCGPAAGQSSCSASGTLIATVNLSTATVSGNNYTVSSGSQTPLVAGSYCFFATWAGDANYPDGASVTNFSDECFTVTPKQPGIVTQVSDDGPVVPGTVVSDTATLSGTAAPSNGVHGTITFTAYGPNDATCATAVYTSIVAVTGNGSYSSEDDPNVGSFAPTAPGTYRWLAAYAPGAGDVNNVAAATACGDANESFVVEQFQPALDTTQTWTVKDSATVTVSGGGDLAGSVTFELHRSATCTDATPILVVSKPVSGPSPQTVETDPQTITVSEPTLYWKVSYTSTKGEHANIAPTCTENSSLTIDNTG